MHGNKLQMIATLRTLKLTWICDGSQRDLDSSSHHTRYIWNEQAQGIQYTAAFPETTLITNSEQKYRFYKNLALDNDKEERLNLVN